MKAVTEIFTPVTGQVAEINSTLLEEPEKLNHDPHGSAWLIKLRLADHSETSSLMDAAGYEAYIAERAK